MSTISTAMADYITLMNRARESQAQRGSAAIDIPDLLIACTQDAGRTGEILRTHSLNTATITHAIERIDSELLGTLGITAKTSSPARPIEDAYTLTPRAESVIKDAHNAQSIALACITEPSGTIADIAQILDLDLHQIEGQLKYSAQSPHKPADPRGIISASTSIFTEEPVDSVWATVSKPANLPHWLPAVDMIEANPSNGVWKAVAVRPDKSRGKVDSKRLDMAVRVLDSDHENHRMVYSMNYLHRPNANIQQVSIALSKVAYGTRAEITSSWHHPEGSTPALARRLLAPLNRFSTYAVKIQATHIGEALRRTLETSDSTTP